MLGAMAGGGLSSSNSEQMSSSSGLTQTFGGINNAVTKGDNSVLMIAAAVFLMTLFVVARKK